MAEIINLRRVRKAKARADAEQKAAENRTQFGRSKAERENAKANTALDEQRLDAHKRRSCDEPED
jgi:hypothetical protein